VLCFIFCRLQLQLIALKPGLKGRARRPWLRGPNGYQTIVGPMARVVFFWGEVINTDDIYMKGFAFQKARKNYSYK